MYLASDNAGPAHPRVIEALSKANEGYAMGYGADPIMARVRAQLRQLFEAPPRPRSFSSPPAPPPTPFRWPR